MKLIFKLICVLLSMLLLSCSSEEPDEGSFYFEGIIIDSTSYLPIDSVLCQLYINKELFKEIKTDSSGSFCLVWSGIINGKNATTIFSKESYSDVILYATADNNDFFNDTIFMTKE